MKKIILYIIILLLTVSCTLYTDDIRNLYFIGGQSNATQLWADTIKDYILIDDPTAIVVWVYHPGNSIAMWYSNGSLQQNYYYDIQMIYDAIQGYNYNLKAIFWYQGEADKLYYNTYRNRFYQLMFGFANGLSDYDFNVYMVLVSLNIGDNGYDNIRRIQIHIANEHPNIYSVDSWGYEKKDWVHLTDDSYMMLGEEIYNMFRLTIE